MGVTDVCVGVGVLVEVCVGVGVIRVVFSLHVPFTHGKPTTDCNSELSTLGFDPHAWIVLPDVQI